MNAEISETVRARLLRLVCRFLSFWRVQIPELPTLFVSVQCHADSNAHKPPKKKSYDIRARQCEMFAAELSGKEKSPAGAL